jgi:DNA repair protein SbcC/Rad50
VISTVVPLTLRLRNFLSYGSEEQVITFGTFPLICLSGKNGHGKSALLDAMTWAIWGQARKVSGTSKPDEHLLHLGKTTMTVVFDFEFNTQQYRVRRDFSHVQGKSYSNLHFGIIDSIKKSVTSLTETTLRKTQARIEQTIGLDYETFINTAFLRQAQANEFSKKSPKDRKEILGSILSLGHYDILRKNAADKSKDALVQISALKHLQERIEQQLSVSSELTAKTALCEEQLRAIETRSNQLQQALKDLNLQQDALTLVQKKYDLGLYQSTVLKKEEHALQEELRTVFSEWRIINKLQRTVPKFVDLHQKKQELITLINQFQQILQKNLEKREKMLKLKEELQIIKIEFQENEEKKLSLQKSVIDTCTAEATSCTQQITQIYEQLKKHEEQLITVQKEIAVTVKTVEELTKKKTFSEKDEQQFEKRKQMYHTWIAQTKQISYEQSQLKHKQELAHDQENPSCPLCEQNLSASRKRFLHAKFTKLEHFYLYRYQKLTSILSRLKAVLIEQNHQKEANKKIDEELQRLTVMVREQNKTEIELTQLISETKKGVTTLQLNHQQLTKKIAEENTKYAEQKKHAQQALEKDSLYESKVKELAVCESSLMVYTAEDHHRAQRALESLQQQEQELAALNQKTALQQQRKDSIHKFCRMLKTIKKNIFNLDRELQTYQNDLIQLSALAEQQEVITTEQKNIVIHKEALLQEHGRYKQQQLYLAKQEEEYKTQNKKISLLTKEAEDFNYIAAAFGKDGIQALLIEEAIPEIENEANLLLSKLTDNQASIMIESLRDLKKGGSKETLDITISDPAGIRPYELYSGGEAFRIDFALRIAISKLLARRAGTSLQTLIIDEGFGSQDDEGLSRIMDAIYKIQDDFKKVIIVSHLPSMKDQFPVHFFVEKKTHGSTVTVIEQD